MDRIKVTIRSASPNTPNIPIDNLIYTINDLYDASQNMNFAEMYRIVYSLCVNKKNDEVFALYATGLQKIKQESDIAKKEIMLQTLNDLFMYARRTGVIKTA